MTLEHQVRPIHLRPATDLAERVLLPGDPHRALMVAQDLLDGPLMFNHARGLWGYTGVAADGEPLTIQSTGMGGPSAAIVCEELIALGARRLVRIGTCGALNGDLALGDLLAASEALPADGASTALGAEQPPAGEPGLTARLVEAGARAVTVVSTDLFYDDREGRWPAGSPAGRPPWRWRRPPSSGWPRSAASRPHAFWESATCPARTAPCARDRSRSRR